MVAENEHSVSGKEGLKHQTSSKNTDKVNIFNTTLTCPHWYWAGLLTGYHPLLTLITLCNMARQISDAGVIVISGHLRLFSHFSLGLVQNHSKSLFDDIDYQYFTLQQPILYHNTIGLKQRA